MKTVGNKERRRRIVADRHRIASHHTAPTPSHRPHTKTITMADHGSNKGFIVKGLVVAGFHRRERLVEDVAAMLNTTIVSW
ncbi:hypothetical protein E3N88_31065 [Mikania micrantha]|uniref:Uncharacterized protein n=1 Tax=Mikania micrantha TaxID=192012 RepID=A0A5N6MNC4_9ASTR|nr:hypothetical protein E3N88_31065 [Mikania micrantha]